MKNHIGPRPKKPAIVTPMPRLTPKIAAKKAELDYTKASALYQDHREQLLSHYKDWPGYQAGRPTAREAARKLIVALTESNDPRLIDFAEHMHMIDTEALTHLLLAPCHLEI